MRLLFAILLIMGMWLSLFSATIAVASSSEPGETEMEKTVVTATRTEISMKDAPGSVTVITAEEIKDLPARDLLEIIRETAGISLLGRSTGGRQTISIRGLDNRHVLILIDGRRIAASNAAMGHSDYENSWVPLENIERIEIVRGPLSSLYGSEAIGGVVNIITRPVAAKWAGGVTIGGGVRDDGNGGQNQNYGVHAGGPLIGERLGLSLSAGYIRDQNTPDETDPGLSAIEGREIFTVASRLSLALNEKHRLELFADLVDEERWLNGISSNRYTETDYELDKSMYGINWSGDVGPCRSRINLYRSEIDKVSTRTFKDDGNQSDTPDKVTNDIADAQTSFSIGGNMITLGGEWRKESLKADTITGGKDEATHQGIYIQDEMELFGRLLLTPGVRWDHHEFFGSEISPRIYATYRLTSAVNLKAGYGRAFNAPTIKQVSPHYYAATGPHVFYGNPDVKAETSNNYEAGVEYYGSLVTARLFYFHNEIKDLIAWDQIGQEGRTRIFKAGNVDSARTRGVETELGATLPYGFDLSFGYTYLEAEDTENDERLTGRPRHTVNAKLKYAYEPLGISAILRYQHIGDQVYTDNNDLKGVPSYSLWHFGLRKQLLTHFDLHVGVENIGDVRMAEKSTLYPYEEQGRFYYATLRATF